jgi:HAD superfamily hydrolase (TIGR01490 family)
VARHAAQQGWFSAHGLRAATLERLCAEVVSAAAGHRQADVVEVAGSVSAAVVGRLYPAARWLVDRHVDAGDHVVLLSAGPHELVAAIAARLELPTALGTVAEVGQDGRYTGQLVGAFCHGTGKLDRLRSLLGPVELLRTTAYGDAASDLPVLRAVAQPVAVNPDRALAGAAMASRWPILRFE